MDHNMRRQRLQADDLYARVMNGMGYRVYFLTWTGSRYEVSAIIRIENLGNARMEAAIYCQEHGYSAFRTEDGQHYRSRGQKITRVSFRWSSAS